MNYKDTRLSIWTTITSLISEIPRDEGLDLEPLRQSIAEYLVREPLSDLGALEFDYSFTGVSSDEGLPDAFALGDEGSELSLFVLIGPVGQRTMPTVPSEVIHETLNHMIITLKRIINGESPLHEAGREGVGEYQSVLQTELGAISAISVKAVVLGVALNDALQSDGKWEQNLELRNRKVVPLRVEVIDVPSLQNQWDRSSGSGTVDLVLADFLNGPLPCLRTTRIGGDFETFLVILPGNALADIYYRYKSQILQKNLRNFLQTTGKVNKAIQYTLKNQPERFLAYNNGLTITASAADLDEAGRITLLRDFQIVNGGQTTASLDYAKRFGGLDLSKVAVQAKITVVDTTADPSFIDDVSNYANSQNKVKLSDFASRDSFHVALAGLMRDNPKLRCESESGGVNYWYYEAFRAGYVTAKNQKVGSDRIRFETNFPKTQVINKLELAKVENIWDGYPFHVCLGDDKNFREWSKRTKPLSRPEPDITFCTELVAKVMLFRSYADLVREQEFKGFRSSITAYAFAFHRHILAFKNYEIDLDQIWTSKTIPDELLDSMRKVVTIVGKFVYTQSEGEDQAQWTKKRAAWEKLIRMHGSNPPSEISSKLMRAKLLREYRLEISVACARALEVMQSASSPLTKNSVLHLARIPNSMWEEVRRNLIENYDVVKVGSGSAMRYVPSELNVRRTKITSRRNPRRSTHILF